MARLPVSPKYTLVYIGFPDGEINCAHCPLLETYSRNMCRRTGEYIVDTKYPGYDCPLLETTEKNIRNHLLEWEMKKNASIQNFARIGNRVPDLGDK